jgi:hypothetical protein
MEADALTRIDTKLDRVLELLDDISLGSDGIEMIEEIIHVIKTKQPDEPASP